jgi:hypothetical protein
MNKYEYEYTELSSSLRESHRFLSLPANTMMASSQGTQPPEMNKREVTLAFIEAYRSLPELWDTENRHYSKQQPCLYPPVTRTRRHTELTKKLSNLMGKLCCATEHSVQFFVQLFLHS